MKTEHESSGDTVVDSLTSQMRLHSEGDESVLAVIDKIVSRSKAGQSKYGVTLERQDLTRLQWLTHAQEEAMDLANYLQVLILREGPEYQTRFNDMQEQALAIACELECRIRFNDYAPQQSTPSA